MMSCSGQHTGKINAHPSQEMLLNGKDIPRVITHARSRQLTQPSEPRHSTRKDRHSVSLLTRGRAIQQHWKGSITTAQSEPVAETHRASRETRHPQAWSGSDAPPVLWSKEYRNHTYTHIHVHTHTHAHTGGPASTQGSALCRWHLEQAISLHWPWIFLCKNTRG